MENKMQNIVNIIRNAETINGTKAIDVEICTSPAMRKRNNPYLDRVKKHTAYIGVDFGKNYTEEVKKRLLAEGKVDEAAAFQAKKTSYEYVNEYFDRIGEQLYLRYMPKNDGEKRVIWEVDGRPATECEIAEIKGFLQGGGKPKNQGLEEGNEVEFRRVKLQNVVAVGGETWAREVA